MSAEYEGRYYTPVIEVREIDINIRTITKKTLNKFFESLVTCLNNKLEKLNLLLKNMNVYEVNGQLLVNDKFISCIDFKEIVKEFGMDVKNINVVGLKGNTYLISDKIIELLMILNQNYEFSKKINIRNIPSNIDISSIDLFKHNELQEKYSNEILDYINEILLKGSVTIKGEETLTDGIRTNFKSNFKEVENKLSDLLNEIKKETVKNSNDVQHGTVEILYRRAKQMGYNVKKESKGDQIQLVLTRM